MALNKKQALALYRMFDQMKAGRENWDSTWRDIAHFVIPDKDDVYEWKNMSRGEEKHGDLYDSSAIHFNELLASALHSFLTNPLAQWFELTTGDAVLDKDPRVRKWLQALTRKIHKILNNTNFQSQIHEVYLDLASLGTGLMLIEKDEDNVIHFKSRPIYQVYIKENARSLVDTVGAEDIMTVRKAFQKYGEESFKKFPRLNEDMEKKITVLHMVMPREDFREGKFASDKKFASVHLYREGSEIVTLKESGYDEFPYIVPRWMKTTGEVYGRSPAMKALPDIKMINQMMKTTIRGAQKEVDPPHTVPDDGVMGRMNTRPGGITPVRAGSAVDIRPLFTGGNARLGLEIIENRTNQVKQHFFIDQLQLRQGPQMTATETNVRDDDRIKLLGPTVGRLHFEMLQPLVGRVIGEMTRQKEIPPDMPSELIGKSPQVFFTSQLAKAQRFTEGDNINRWVGSIAPLIELDPATLLKVVDVEKYIRFNAEIYGVPEEIFRSSRDIKLLDEQQQQAAQAQAEQQQNMENAQIAKDTQGTEQAPLQSGV